MYKISLPIQSRTLNDENKPIFVSLCKKAGVARVFLTASLSENLDELRENIAYFKNEGFDVGIWVGNTIGHGATLLNGADTGPNPKYQPLVNLDGNPLHSTNCPYDKNFQTYVAKSVAALTACGTDMLMLDDDYRLSQHGHSPACACPLHMAKISEFCGEEVKVEDLNALAFTGKRNKYRDAWFKAQGESLEELAKVIRDEVDKVNPNASVSACSAYCSWDLDGTDPIRLTKILCGKNKKFLRLHGAPYWAPLNDKPTLAIPEFERMFASFCEGEDIEIFAEGDVYPRPRFIVPSSGLEILDGALRADKKMDGILKYMLHYGSRPLDEVGYIERHCYNKNKYAGIEKFFEKGANAGVRVLIKPHLLNDTNFDDSSVRQQSPYPTAGIFLGMNAIPTIYSGEGVCSALFGECARHFDVEDFKNGAILDGVAAKILTERGIDVGLESVATFTDNTFGSVIDERSGLGSIAISGKMKRLCGNFKENARTVLSVDIGGTKRTFAYTYENANGQKFLVFTFSADALPTNPKFLYSYSIQSVLLEAIEWIGDRALPVKTAENPHLYTLCEKGENYTSVALFNCFPDSALNTVIILDKEYSNIEFNNCTGHIDGNKVILSGELHAFDFASFKAYN